MVESYGEVNSYQRNMKAVLVELSVLLVLDTAYRCQAGGCPEGPEEPKEPGRKDAAIPEVLKAKNFQVVTHLPPEIGDAVRANRSEKLSDKYRNLSTRTVHGPGGGLVFPLDNGAIMALDGKYADVVEVVEPMSNGWGRF